MRHQKTRNKLSRDSAHRKALLMNLVQGADRARADQNHPGQGQGGPPEVEKLITLAKRGDLHARRQALSTLSQDKFAVHKLFVEVAPRYAERPGGYTRILKLDPVRSGTRPRWSSSSSSEAAGAADGRLPMVTELTLEYDGAGFCGWARQPGERTVEEELERALHTILGRTATTASRCD